MTEVLGTHFNINTYTAASEKITLLEGAVRVRNSAGVVRELSPGEQATAAPGNPGRRLADQLVANGLVRGEALRLTEPIELVVAVA